MRPLPLPSRLLYVFVALALTAGCSSREPYTFGSPDGWVTSGDRWFVADLDTAGVFRDLSSLESMSAKGARLTYSADTQLSRQRSLALQQLSRAVKQSLIQLFRNQPEVVDSLFEMLVVPKLADADLGRDPDRLVDRYQKEAYRVIARHFREPRGTLLPGEDIRVTYPDSLRSAGIGGEVEMQIYVNEQGEPVAIEKLSGVHRVLDDIAMKVLAQARWQPAYLLRVGKSYPLPAWVRYNIDFRMQ